MKGQDLKHRINGARETVQITRAMQLISVSKMAKTEKRMESSRGFLLSMKSICGKIKIGDHPFCEKKEGDRTVFVVVAGDKGLCGDYNHKVLDKAKEEILSCTAVKVFIVGQYCREYFKKEGISVANTYVHMLQEPFTEDAIDMADELIKMFLEDKADRVILVYTDVGAESHSEQTVVSHRLLPLDIEEDKNSEKSDLEYRNDITGILKQYIWSNIYYSLCCAGYAVNFKRMTAMQQATTNGEKLVDELNTQYNHLRQESITNELLDAGIAKMGVTGMTGERKDE